MPTMRHLLVLLAALLLLAPAARAQTRPVGSPPLSDAAAAKQVKLSSFEPRPDNAKPNAKMLSKAQVTAFRAKSDMVYKDRVTGHYTGTTDEIIQWAAAKHGIDPDILRAVAVVESYWHMSTVGDDGNSFGLYQIRQPYHCCKQYAQSSTAFNADYYGAIIRAYYDGQETWLNDEEHGQPYAAGDIWGSVGAWYAGRWHTPDADAYIAEVKQTMADMTWLDPDF
jgi:autotransporter family porin